MIISAASRPIPLAHVTAVFIRMLVTRKPPQVLEGMQIHLEAQFFSAAVGAHFPPGLPTWE